jgi:hypothetical protein
MRCVGALVAPLFALVWPFVAAAADLAYVGPPGTPAEQAAETARAHSGNDRSVALATTTAVVDAVKRGQVHEGMIPAITADGIPGETTTLLLRARDPGMRILGEERIADRQGGATDYWLIVSTKEHLFEQHPDRLVVNIDAPAESKAFSLVVAGLSKLGFTVTEVTSVTLPGKPFGFRYMVALAADKPILVLRATDAIARDARAGEGRAVLIGAWKQVP